MGVPLTQFANTIVGGSTVASDGSVMLSASCASGVGVVVYCGTLLSVRRL